jgi:aspartyl-tRNA(Asn)/glutamyl-tRNA(Gln) amidotransferase subunit A
VTSPTEPGLLAAADLLRLYRRRGLSPVEVARDCLARIERWSGAFGAFRLADPDGALRAARASEARWRRGEPAGLLDGVPATVKDIVLVRGFPTRRGSLTTEGAAPDEADAPATARLREAGAVLLGKTTTPEFGWKAVTDNPLGEVARNPWDRSRTAGGSSGGAAVAAALGMGALHLGTDGGGSIRVPASFCGVVGLKPTFGRVPAWPLSPFGTVAHLGPMARTVGDAALMLTVLARPDPRDWTALPYDGRDWRVGLEEGVDGLRVAACESLGLGEVDPEVLAAFRSAVAALEELGAVVEPVALDLASARDVFARHWFPSAARVLAGLPPERLALVDPGLREMAAEGAAMTAAEILDAQRERGELALRLHLLLDEHDLLVTPATALPAFAAGVERPDPGRQRRWIDWAGFSHPFNLSQQPAISVPCGPTAAGLPVGLQIVAAKHREDLVLRAARAFEAARPAPRPPAPV